MQREPRTLRLKTQKKQARQAAAFGSSRALDAAFAEYVRIDGANPQQATSPASVRLLRGDDLRPMKTLVADITAQLAALDRQREQLAALLRGI